MGAEAYEKVWGPLLRGKFGDRADDISMAWLWGKLDAAQAAEQGVAAGAARLPAPLRWEPLFGELERRIEAGGGRVLIDRPVKRLARTRSPASRSSSAPPARFAPATTRAFGRRGGERYDAVVATVPNDVFAGMLEPELLDDGYLALLDGIEYHTARSACCSSSTGASPLLLDQHRRPRAAFVA